MFSVTNLVTSYCINSPIRDNNQWYATTQTQKRGQGIGIFVVLDCTTEGQFFKTQLAPGLGEGEHHDSKRNEPNAKDH